MIFLSTLIFITSAYEIWRMAKRKQYREIIVVTVIAVLSLSLGYFYLSGPLDRSLVHIFFSMREK